METVVPNTVQKQTESWNKYTKNLLIYYKEIYTYIIMSDWIKMDCRVWKLNISTRILNGKRPMGRPRALWIDTVKTSSSYCKVRLGHTDEDITNA